MCVSTHICWKLILSIQKFAVLWSMSSISDSSEQFYVRITLRFYFRLELKAKDRKGAISGTHTSTGRILILSFTTDFGKEHS